MKDDLLINEKLIEEAINVTGLQNKQEVIELGLKTLIKLKQQEKIKNYRGKLQWDGNLEELRTNPSPSKLIISLPNIDLRCEIYILLLRKKIFNL